MKVSNILATRLARRTNNKGLTLIELLVVLVILIALAGILIPQLPNMLVRTHAAAGSTNITEVNKRIQEFEQVYFKHPANLDNLVDNGGDDAKHDYVVGGTELTVVALTDVLGEGTAVAIQNAGITDVADLVAVPDHATFGNYATPVTTTPIAAGVNVASVTPAAVRRLLRPTAVDTDVFVAFGVGQASEIIGRTANEAGYHFGEGPGENPEEIYARFAAVYKVADAGTALERAEFVGVVSIHGDELANSSDHVGEFFETNEL
jgi:prepilin-type N-terminal cleavage/methylation domain-containing protein